MFKRFINTFSNDIGIDLGTANTLVHVRGQGVVINEPSVVAINKKTGRIVAIGAEAKAMLGRTPSHIDVIRPLVDGVISDFEITEEMLSYLLNKVERMGKRMFRPRVVIGVPSGVTTVETRAVYDAARSAGAREVYIVEEPLAAAIGVELPVQEPNGSMVIDIGGGTTDIAVMSLGGIVFSKNVKIAGDRFNMDIIQYMRSEFKLLIGEKTAEEIKMAIGTVMEGESTEVIVRGRDLVTGLPREVIVTDTDVRSALHHSVDVLIDGVKEVLETIPPELLSDIMRRGIYLTGGGALLRGFAGLIERSLKVPVHVADEPLMAVVYGTGIILEDLELYRDVLIDEHDETL